MLYVEKYLPFLSVVTYQRMDCVTISHPTNQTRVGGQRDGGKPCYPVGNIKTNSGLQLTVHVYKDYN